MPWRQRAWEWLKYIKKMKLLFKINSLVFLAIQLLLEISDTEYHILKYYLKMSKRCTSLVMTMILRNFVIIPKELYRQTTETFCFRNNEF